MIVKTPLHLSHRHRFSTKRLLGSDAVTTADNLVIWPAIVVTHLLQMVKGLIKTEVFTLLRIPLLHAPQILLTLIRFLFFSDEEKCRQVTVEDRAVTAFVHRYRWKGYLLMIYLIRVLTLPSLENGCLTL